MAIWDVKINGVNLHTQASGVDGLPGFGGMPGRVDSSVAVFGNDGLSSQVGLFNPGEYVIEMWLDGVDRATGLVTTTREQHLWDNLSWVNRLFASDGLLTVSITMPDGSVRTAGCEMIAAVPPTFLNRFCMRLKFAMRIPGVYWTGDDFTSIIDGRGTVVLDAGASDGFMNDLFLRVQVNPFHTILTPKFVANNIGTPVKPYVSISSIVAGSLTRRWELDCAAATSESHNISLHDGTAVGDASPTPLGELDYAGSLGLLFRVGPPYSITFSHGSAASEDPYVSAVIFGNRKFF